VKVDALARSILQRSYLQRDARVHLDARVGVPSASDRTRRTKSKISIHRSIVHRRETPTCNARSLTTAQDYVAMITNEANGAMR
jgi:hypothetical protein